MAKVEIAAGEAGGEGKEEKLYLSMVRKKDGKTLPFANGRRGKPALIGRWMGRVKTAWKRKRKHRLIL